MSLESLPARLPSLSFVFPMYNEIGNIERTVLGALDVGSRIADEVEVIIVDDASTDGCSAVADALAREHRAVRVIHHPKNRKLGGALRTGFSTASKEWVLYIDSDLPIDLNEAARAVPLALGGNDLVIGWRRNRNEGLKREIMSLAYNRLIRLLFGLKVRDVNFAFKLIHKDVLNAITLRSEGSFIDAELLIESWRAGFAIGELGLEYYPRTAGVSTLASNGVVFKILREMQAYRQANQGRSRRDKGDAALAVAKTPYRQR